MKKIFLGYRGISEDTSIRKIFKIEDEITSCEQKLTLYEVFILFWVLNSDASVIISKSFTSFDTYYITTTTMKDYGTLKNWLENNAEVIL